MLERVKIDGLATPRSIADTKVRSTSASVATVSWDFPAAIRSRLRLRPNSVQIKLRALGVSCEFVLVMDTNDAQNKTHAPRCIHCISKRCILIIRLCKEKYRAVLLRRHLFVNSSGRFVSQVTALGLVCCPREMNEASVRWRRMIGLVEQVHPALMRRPRTIVTRENSFRGCETSLLFADPITVRMHDANSTGGSSMRLLILSDLHLEVWREHAPRIDTSISKPDLVILAGDIHTRSRAPAWAAATFPGVPVLYIAGNHEFYGEAIEKVGETILKECEIYPNVHYLDCGEFVLDGIRFLGVTLWTDFSLFNPDRR